VCVALRLVCPNVEVVEGSGCSGLSVVRVGRFDGRWVFRRMSKDSI
jgi:hypothetical protein